MILKKNRCYIIFDNKLWKSLDHDSKYHGFSQILKIPAVLFYDFNAMSNLKEATICILTNTLKYFYMT